MSECIFCKIIEGKAESSKIYEDERILVFMNIRPVNKGEFLVIPKVHIDHFTDLPDEIASHILITAQQISKKLLATLKPKRVGYVVHGFGVAHAHLNVVPLNDSSDIVSLKFLKIENNFPIVDFNLIPVLGRDELDYYANLLK